MSEFDPPPETAARELELIDVTSLRGGVEVLHGVSLSVGAEIVAILGLNASGKSTLLRTISGLTPATRGRIMFEGSDIVGMSAHRVARAGLSFMQQDGQVFPSLDVLENLRMAATNVSKRELEHETERVLDYVPQLRSRLARKGRHLSGGERQMLALAMALIRQPRLLLLDEPSAGLAPSALTAIYETLERLRDEHMPIVIAEQNIQRVLDVADRAIVLLLGRVVAEFDVRADSHIEAIKTAMLGAGDSSNGRQPSATPSRHAHT